MATNRDELSSLLVDNINKKFKGQSKVAYFLDGSEQTPTDLTECVSTGDDMLDLAISNRPNGGFPVGRIVEVTGLEASGKSLLSAHTLANTHKKGGLAVYIDTENAINQEFLEALGVDIIEAGFPAASKGDLEAVTEISKIIKNSKVCGLSRASKFDIDAANSALKYAAQPRIHTFISTSELHMTHKLELSAEQVYEKVIDSVSYARNLCDDVEWSCEDGTRTDRDFMCSTVEAAIKSGATTINIPDTVGYSVPEEFSDIITHLINTVPNIDKAIISTHCHNDLGVAVAN